MKGLKILVVDDMRSIGQGVAGMIEDAFPGCEVVLATSPHEAFLALEKAHSVIVSDFNLKNSTHNGVDILFKARQKYGRRVLTVLMSADFEKILPGLSIGEAKQGINHFLEKPIEDVGRLEEVIKDFIGANDAK